MLRVYKYPISLGESVIDMPVDAQVLTVQMQHGQPCVWALVDPSAPTKQRAFRVFGTGHDIDERDRLSYVGTFQMHGGGLVWHLFERRVR